jgi:hypothetical protein
MNSGKGGCAGASAMILFKKIVFSYPLCARGFKGLLEQLASESVGAEIAARRETRPKLARRQPVTAATIRKWPSRTDFQERSPVESRLTRNLLPAQWFSLLRPACAP